MYYLIVCTDKPGQLETRMANREAHLAHIGSRGDDLLAGGPTITDDGQTPTGSAYIMDFPDRAAAEAFAQADPYNQAGVFGSIAVTPWRKIFPED
ncbi:MAG: YciI family protein [Rhodospirillaceae bacterium]|nr:YciI family protein [Rhodospirillaceae bacterium]